MQLTMSMFATQADYWKARAEFAEQTVEETVAALGCANDNEAILSAISALQEALLRVKRWGGMGNGWDSGVACDLIAWIDGDMKGPLPSLPEHLKPNKK